MSWLMRAGNEPSHRRNRFTGPGRKLCASTDQICGSTSIVCRGERDDVHRPRAAGRACGCETVPAVQTIVPYVRVLDVVDRFLMVVSAEHEVDPPSPTNAFAARCRVRESVAVRDLARSGLWCITMTRWSPFGAASNFARASAICALLMLPTTPTSRGFQVIVPGTTPCAVLSPTKVTPGTMSTGSRSAEMYFA